jgi:hypothetical protein
MLAMGVNDYAGSLTPRGVFELFASMLTPTRDSELSYASCN